MKQILFIFLSFAIFSCSNQIVPANTVTTKPLPDSAFIGLQTYPLASAKDLDTLLSKIGDAKVVLLGEATHGTAEFYNWRTEISKRLIIEKGFNTIAVEGDWADGIRVNNFIIGNKKDSIEVLRVLQLFDRWPSFLWANTEFLNFMLWLNNYNATRSASKKITFYGTDLFSIIDAADTMSHRLNSDTVMAAIEQFRNCFDLFANDEQLYAKQDQKANCSEQSKHLLEVTNKYNLGKDSLSALFFLQAALTVFNGEQYFRLQRNRTDVWNIRENHMAESIRRLTDTDANKRKVIVWMHNSHTGDAFYASTHWSGRTSVGEILREKMGEKNVYIIGFGSYSGYVTASQSWGGKIEQMQLANAENATWEQTLHSMWGNDKYVILHDTALNNKLKTRWIYTRSIGVIYHNNERSGMKLSRVAKRFDAYIFIDHSTPVHPLHIQVKKAGIKIDE